MPPTATQLPGASISEWSAKKLTNPAVKDAAPALAVEAPKVPFADALFVVDSPVCEEETVDADVGALLEADSAAVAEVLTE
ncbi:MAG: hypothetical protein OK454_05255 [Thaumarchaeota archaeon]|nr:hypothetical protein [Nitrososphaerota archaeon]